MYFLAGLCIVSAYRSFATKKNSTFWGAVLFLPLAVGYKGRSEIEDSCRTHNNFIFLLESLYAMLYDIRTRYII